MEEFGETISALQAQAFFIIIFKYIYSYSDPLSLEVLCANFVRRCSVPYLEYSGKEALEGIIYFLKVLSNFAYSLPAPKTMQVL